MFCNFFNENNDSREMEAAGERQKEDTELNPSGETTQHR